MPINSLQRRDDIFSSSELYISLKIALRNFSLASRAVVTGTCTSAAILPRGAKVGWDRWRLLVSYPGGVYYLVSCPTGLALMRISASPAGHEI